MNDIKLKREIREVIAKKADDWLSNIDKNIEDKLELALLSILGLEKDYHRGYEIDHCNGRNSVFIDILRDKAKIEAEKLIGKVGFLKKDVDFKQFKLAFKREYDTKFQNAIRDLARKKADENAIEYFNKIFKNELKKKIAEQ